MPANKLSARFSVQGRGLNALMSVAPKLVQEAVDTTALLIESGAKELVPVDTGRARASIAAVTGLPNGSAKVEVGVTYALALELGSRGRPGRPFLYPAVELERQRFVERLKAAFAGR